jgi:hypothetical protein
MEASLTARPSCLATFIMRPVIRCEVGRLHAGRRAGAEQCQLRARDITGDGWHTQQHNAAQLRVESQA